MNFKYDIDDLVMITLGQWESSYSPNRDKPEEQRIGRIGAIRAHYKNGQEYLIILKWRGLTGWGGQPLGTIQEEIWMREDRITKINVYETHDP